MLGVTRIASCRARSVAVSAINWCPPLREAVRSAVRRAIVRWPGRCSTTSPVQRRPPQARALPPPPLPALLPGGSAVRLVPRQRRQRTRCRHLLPHPRRRPRPLRLSPRSRRPRALRRRNRPPMERRLPRRERRQSLPRAPLRLHLPPSPGIVPRLSGARWRCCSPWCSASVCSRGGC